MAWSALGAATGLASAAAGAYLLQSRGLISLDLGVGRSVHPLGPITELIHAPRELVYETLSAPYLGQMPASLRGKIEILERSPDLVVALHRTALPVADAITVETVAFEPPDRITFRLLRGPVPSVSEEFRLEEREAATLVTYEGRLEADLWGLGRLYGGRIVKPVWERVVRESLAQAKSAAEDRAAGRRRRTASSES